MATTTATKGRASKPADTTPTPPAPGSVKDKEVQRIAAACLKPFEAGEVKFRPGGKPYNNRCLALAYVDARVVQDRLDEVFGINGWQDEYEYLPDGNVLCKLDVWMHDEWVHKSDVGGQSEQDDAGDRMKSAVSDSLKRAAVKLGIGRYLYRLGQSWANVEVGQNGKVRGFTNQLFLDPETGKVIEKQKSSSKAPGNGNNGTAPSAPAAPSSAEQPKPPPANGQEFVDRLAAYEAKLAKQGLCKKDELLSFVAKSIPKRPEGVALEDWKDQAAFEKAGEAVKKFEAQARAAKEKAKSRAPAKRSA